MRRKGIPKNTRMKITDNVYGIPRVTAHAYLLVETDGLTLIDTGLPYSERIILHYLARQGWAARDLKRILVSHADLDHYGCLAELQKLTGARIYAGAIEAKAIARGRSSRPIDPRRNTASQRLVMAFFNWMM